MKEQILTALKTKFTGVQDAILNRIADKLAKTVKTEEEVATAVEGVTLQSVIDGYADSRATEAAQTAVSTYEKKHNIKDGKPEKAGEPEKKNPADTKGSDDTPEWAKALIESNKTLAEKLAKIEGEKAANNRLKELNKVIENAPDTIKSRFGKDFNKMNFKTDEEYQEWLADVKADVETLVTDLTAAGAVFKKPAGGGGTPPPSKPSAEVEARIKEREVEATQNVIVGLPTK